MIGRQGNPSIVQGMFEGLVLSESGKFEEWPEVQHG